ncbi:Nicotianamine synthase [Circinella umbellata]|nr:Nicotianamine synthase [Circinella umbellata]
MNYYPPTTNTNTSTTVGIETNGFSTKKVTTTSNVSSLKKSNKINNNTTLPSSTLGQILINEIKRIYHGLASSRSLEPSDSINTLFTELVNLCISHRDPDLARIVLKDSKIQKLTPHLRSLCATGEYLLERQWANKLITPLYDIPEFTYANNYKLLVRLELHALLGIGANLSHMIFIGSGPLPLSSMEFIWQSSNNNNNNEIEGGIQRIDNIDKSQEAIDVSKKLAIKYGLQDKMKFYAQDALEEFQGYEKADVIMLGALVGSNNQEKKEFLCHITNKMKSGAILMVRSSNCLRELLYSNTCQLVLEDNNGLEPLVEIHPQNEVVNSVILAQKI